MSEELAEEVTEEIIRASIENAHGEGVHEDVGNISENASENASEEGFREAVENASWEGVQEAVEDVTGPAVFYMNGHTSVENGVLPGTATGTVTEAQALVAPSVRQDTAPPVLPQQPIYYQAPGPSTLSAHNGLDLQTGQTSQTPYIGPNQSIQANFNTRSNPHRSETRSLLGNARMESFPHYHYYDPDTPIGLNPYLGPTANQWANTLRILRQNSGADSRRTSTHNTGANSHYSYAPNLAYLARDPTMAGNIPIGGDPFIAPNLSTGENPHRAPSSYIEADAQRQSAPHDAPDPSMARNTQRRPHPFQAPQVSSRLNPYPPRNAQTGIRYHNDLYTQRSQRVQGHQERQPV